jgi:hypothetical protein
MFKICGKSKHFKQKNSFMISKDEVIVKPYLVLVNNKNRGNIIVLISYCIDNN